MVKRTLISTIFLIISFPSQASNFQNCNQVFYNKTPPQITNPALAKDNIQLCFTGFAVNYSGQTKTGLWSAELITPDSLAKAKDIPRENNFYEEMRIPAKVRSLNADYRGSGFDRGHLAAAANRFSKKDKDESFSLANMIPQSPYNNQEVWRNIEEATRTYVTKTQQPVYVITGGLYLGPKLRTVGNSVLVPTHVYKVVMFPRTGIIGSWVAVNDESGRMDVASVAELERYAGIRFFPTLQDTRALNYRYMLPVSSNKAYKMQVIQIASDNQNSGIFQTLPSSEYKSNASRSLSNEDYKNNRNEVDQMKNQAIDAGIDIIKKVLR